MSDNDKIRAIVIPKALFTKTELGNNRNVGLDIARAFCAIIVVVAHTNNYMREFTGAYRYIFPLGYMIQDLFFGLSGFLVGSQIIKKINNGGTVLNLFVFYKNRWVRTIPFYMIFLAINYFMFLHVYNHSSLGFFFNDFQISDYVFFLQSFSNPHPSFFPEIWPIPIEEWSFLCLPIPVLLFTGLLKKPMTQKQLLVLLVVEIVLANIVRINYILHNEFQTDWGLRKIVIYRFDALIYGFLLSVLIDKFNTFFIRNKKVLFFISFPLCYVLYFCISFMNLKLYQSLLFCVFPLFMSLTIPFFYFQEFQILKNKLRSMLTHISLISYSILLSHLYLIQFSMLNMYKPTNFWQGIIFTVLYFSIVLFFATLFFNYVERPILLLRKKKLN